jgi:hypothetical protein
MPEAFSQATVISKWRLADINSLACDEDQVLITRYRHGTARRLLSANPLGCFGLRVIKHANYRVSKALITVNSNTIIASVYLPT